MSEIDTPEQIQTVAEYMGIDSGDWSEVQWLHFGVREYLKNGDTRLLRDEDKVHRYAALNDLKLPFNQTPAGQKVLWDALKAKVAEINEHPSARSQCHWNADGWGAMVYTEDRHPSLEGQTVTHIIEAYATGLQLQDRGDKVEIRVKRSTHYDEDFWDMKVNWLSDPKQNQRQVIINNQHYMLGDPSPSNNSFRGFGGRTFYIKFLDSHPHYKPGVIVKCNNLWSQGTIPEPYQPILKPNAEFVTEEEFDKYWDVHAH